MAWQNEMTLMVRYIIGDVDSPQKYSDSRLQQAIVIGAQFVNPSLNFSQTFTIDVAGTGISPDPTVNPYIDDWFTNLTVLKTAYQITFAEWKLLTNGGAIMFKEGSATVDMRDLAKHKKDLMQDLEAQYDNSRLTYQMAVRPSVASVIGPFNIYAGNFRGPVYPYSQRDRIFM